MKGNTLRAIALVLMLLIGVWLGARLLSHRSDSVRATLRLPRITAAQTDSIVIRHQRDTVRLARTGTTWTVNGLRAGSEPIGQLFVAFLDTVAPELAGMSPSSFQRMGVDSAGGYWLSIWSGGKATVQLVIGAQATETASGYLRRAGSDSILLWRGELIDLTRRPVDQWRDRRIVGVAPESVLAVDVTARRPYALRKSGATWRFAGGGATDSARVAGLLSEYRSFSASGFGTAAQADSGRKPAARRVVTLAGAGGRKLMEMTFDSSATGIWARLAGDSNVYRVDAWRLNSFAPPDSALRFHAPARPAAAPRH